MAYSIFCRVGLFLYICVMIKLSRNEIKEIEKIKYNLNQFDIILFQE